MSIAHSYHTVQLGMNTRHISQSKAEGGTYVKCQTFPLMVRMLSHFMAFSLALRPSTGIWTIFGAGFCTLSKENILFLTERERVVLP